MNLYYSLGACSLASHIALIESGTKFRAISVDLHCHKYEGEHDFYNINPKGAVPAIQLDDGTVLTENAAVLQYIADINPQAKLAPPASEFDRYRLQEWLNFLASEVHKSFEVFFNPGARTEEKEKGEAKLKFHFQIISAALKKEEFLVGGVCSVADFYLFVMLTWVRKFDLKMADKGELDLFFNRIHRRASVTVAQNAEQMPKSQQPTT